MIRLYSILIGFIALAGVGCMQGSKKNIIPGPPRDSMSTYQQFVDSYTFPYVASKTKQDEVKRNYSKLSLGLSKSEVAKIIGTPDYSEESYSKENNPIKYLGSVWVYYFEKQNPNLSNEKTDKKINVFFSPEGKIHWVISNIEGLTEIGQAGCNK